MKLIHCSDLHLDSRMDSGLPADMARRRREELIETFSRMVTYARENAVRVILICGDLFDSERITRRTVDLVLSCVERSSDIDFLYLRGNHDESRNAFRGRVIPGNLKLFSDTWTSYRYGDLRISGVEFTPDNGASVYEDLKLSPEDTNIVMLHGSVSSSPGQDLVCLNGLRNRNIHYLALGHYHTWQEETLDATGRYAYSGCLEGRGFDETGPKGFVLLEAMNHRVRSAFVPFACRQFREIDVDISGLETVNQIADAMETASQDADSRDLVRFTLRGTCSLDTQKHFAHLLSRFQGRFCFVKIRDESRLEIDPKTYEHDISLKGEFIRLVMASDRSPEEKEKILSLGLQALSGGDIDL